MPKIGARFYTHLELLENQSDVIENELLKVNFVVINIIEISMVKIHINKIQ